eukprot:763965-Hanusia_phi.AAC.2
MPVMLKSNALKGVPSDLLHPNILRHVSAALPCYLRLVEKLTDGTGTSDANGKLIPKLHCQATNETSFAAECTIRAMYPAQAGLPRAGDDARFAPTANLTSCSFELALLALIAVQTAIAAMVAAVTESTLLASVSSSRAVPTVLVCGAISGALIVLVASGILDVRTALDAMVACDWQPAAFGDFWQVLLLDKRPHTLLALHHFQHDKAFKTPRDFFSPGLTAPWFCPRSPHELSYSVSRSRTPYLDFFWRSRS